MIATGSHDWPGFIRANTVLTRPPLVPEIEIHLAAESLRVWQSTEDELAEQNVAPPYWAFAWAGGQALARYVLDHSSVVANRRVLDLGTGCGLSAIAAKLAGAAHVIAADIDEIACVAATLNADANGVSIDVTSEDLLPDIGHDPAMHDADVVLIGDVFYEQRLAARVLALIDDYEARGAVVLTGDPQRTYFPTARFDRLAEYAVPVSRELEDHDVKQTSVWRLRSTSRV